MPVNIINAHPVRVKKGANTQSEKLANEYFLEKNKDVYRFVFSKPEKTHKKDDLAIESFEDYLNQRWGNSCFYYSTAGLMGLEDDDQLVRGATTFNGYGIDGYTFLHGWDEFDFENNEYVFDCLYDGVVNKKEYYELHKAQAMFSASRKEVLDSYLSNKCSVKNGNTWVTKKIDNADAYGLNRVAIFPGSRFVMSRNKLKKCILDLHNLHSNSIDNNQITI